jgi:hypothetical protein
MSDEEWARLIKELGRYALSISRRLRWRTGNSYELPGGETVDSIVSKAIQMVLAGAFECAGVDNHPLPGVRRWNPQKDQDLKKYLMNVIRSVLNHLATGDENRKFRPAPEEGSQDGCQWESGRSDRTPDTEWLARQGRTPEEILLDEEAVALNDRALEMLVEEAGDDPALTKVIRAMRDGRVNPAEIAKAASMTASEVYSAMKRLDRKAAAVRRRISGAVGLSD